MNYSFDAIDALAEDVERQGGARLPESHVPLDVVFTKPPYKRAKRYKGSTIPFNSCGHETLFIETYEHGLDEPGKHPRGAGFVKVCAVCDDMGRWPRHEKAVYAADPDMMLPPDEEEDDEDA